MDQRHYDWVMDLKPGDLAYDLEGQQVEVVSIRNLEGASTGWGLLTCVLVIFGLDRVALRTLEHGKKNGGAVVLDRMVTFRDRREIHASRIAPVNVRG